MKHDLASPDTASPDVTVPDMPQPDLAAALDLPVPDAAPPDKAIPDLLAVDLKSADLLGPDLRETKPDVGFSDTRRKDRTTTDQRGPDKKLKQDRMVDKAKPPGDRTPGGEPALPPGDGSGCACRQARDASENWSALAWLLMLVGILRCRHSTKVS